MRGMRGRIFTGVLTLALVCALAFAPAAGAVTEGEIDELKQQSADLEEQMAAVSEKINSLEYEQYATGKKKEVLDEQMVLTQNEIDNIIEQIAVYDELIAEKQLEVEQAQAEEDAQWEAYKERVRAMEENGVISYLAVIFESADFADLLSRLDFVNRIMQSDKQLYEAIDAARLATIAAQEALQQAQDGQRAQQEELETKKAELAQQVQDASTLMAELQNTIDEQESYYAELDAQQAALDEELQDLIARYEEEQARLSGSAVSGTGSFIWPAPDSNVLTDVYGWREVHPVYGTSRMHNGIDIGAAYGTEVLAADGGTVITVAYDSGGYGNYVMINHGNGMSTLYAHMSAVYVYEGQVVSQGEQIGAVGMTGGVTGPHLHFEVWIGDGRTDPLNYFTNYVY